MFKIVFVITIVSFGIQLKTESSSKERAHPRSLTEKRNKEKPNKSSLPGASVHKTRLRKTPQPRKLGGTIVDVLQSKFSSVVAESYVDGNGDVINREDSVLNDITASEILKDTPALDFTKKESVKAFQETLADHEIAKVEKMMEKLGASEETNPESMITVENVCDQGKMSSVDEWTIDYFTQFFMDSATAMHATGLNLKVSVFKHVSRVETYRLTVQTYNIKVLQKFTMVYLTARVMMILKAAGGFIGLKVSFKSFTIDKVKPTDTQVVAFLNEMKKKMFRQDLIETTYKDFKFRVETLQMTTMEAYYKKHFADKDGKNGLDATDLNQIKLGRDEQIVRGVCGLVVTFIKLIMTDTPAQKKYLDTYSAKTPVPMEYIKNFLKTFGRLFVPDLDEFGNPIKEIKEWSEGKEVGFFWQNCYSMDAKDLEPGTTPDISDKKDNDARVKFVNVFSLLTFIIFGKDLNLPTAPFLARNFFSRTYMLNVNENVDADLLLIIEKDTFLLFTELKAEADFWDYFNSAKSYTTNFIFHVQFYNDFLVVPIEVGGKTALFSATYGASGIYPSFAALTNESTDKNAKEMARNMYIVLNNIYLVYSYMKLTDGAALTAIKFDADVKLIYHAIIKFLITPQKIQAFYDAPEVKDKTIAECYLDVLTYLCYKVGTDCSEYNKPELKVPDTMKTLTETLSFKMTITILISYKTIFKMTLQITKAATQLKEVKDQFDKLELTKIHWKCRNLVDSTDALCKEHVETYKQWVVIIKMIFKEEYLIFVRRSFEVILAYKHPSLGEETIRVFMIYILKYINDQKKVLKGLPAPEKKILSIIVKTLYPVMRKQYSSFLSAKIQYHLLFFIFRLFETSVKTKEFKRKFKILEEFEYVDLKMIMFHVILSKLGQADKAPIRPQDKRTLSPVNNPDQQKFPSYLQMILKIVVNMKNKMELDPGNPQMADKDALDLWKKENNLQPPPENDPNPDPELYIRWIETYSKLTMYAQILGFFDVFQADDQKLEGLLDYKSQNYMNIYYNYFVIASHSIASGVADIYDFQEFIYEKMNGCMIATAEVQPVPEMMSICHNLSHRKWAELYYFVKYMYVVINGTPNISVLDYYTDTEPITSVRVFISIAQTLSFTASMTSFCTEEVKKIQVLCMAFGILDILKSHVQSTSQKSMSTEELNDKIYDDYGQDRSPEGIKKLQTALLIASDTLKYYSESKIETSRFESFFDYTRAETLMANSKNPQVKAFINKKHEFYDKKVYIMQSTDPKSKPFMASYLRRTFVKYVKDQNEEPIQMAVNKLLEAAPQVINKFFITTNLPDFHYLKPILQYTNPANYEKLAQLMIDNNIFLQIPSMNDPKTDHLWVRLIEYVGCTTYPNVDAYDAAKNKDRGVLPEKSIFPCKYQTDKNGHSMYLKRLLEYISIKGRLDKLDKDLDIEEFNEDVTKSEIVEDEIGSHDTILHEIENIDNDANKILEENKKAIDGMAKSIAEKEKVITKETFQQITVVVTPKAPKKMIIVTMQIEVEENEVESYDEQEEASRIFRDKEGREYKILSKEIKTVGGKDVPESTFIGSMGSSLLSQEKNQLTTIETLQEECNVVDEEEERLGSITVLDRTTKSFKTSFESSVTMHTSRVGSLKMLQI